MQATVMLHDYAMENLRHFTVHNYARVCACVYDVCKCVSCECMLLICTSHTILIIFSA